MANAVVLAGLILVASCRPVSAQTFERIYTVSEWAVLAGHSMDIASTQRCLGSGRCRELNPWLARVNSPVGFTAAKFGLAAAQLIVTRRMKAAGHPKWAAVTNYAIAGAFVGIALRNQAVGR
jgi:hypothetical protein